MKKISLIILILTSINCSAQQWPESDAEWTYCGLSNNDMDNFFFAGPFKIYYTHDTLIAGQIYNISEAQLYSTYKYITRYSNDTIYRWVNGAEYLFFHFQLHLGEVITTYRSIGGSSDTSCTSILPLKVIDSTTVIINGQSLTRWRLLDTLGFDPYSSGSPLYAEHLLYERLGPDSYPWFYNHYEDINCEMFSDAGYSYLDGYVDDTFPEWVANCPTASIEKNEAEQILIYPNPTLEKINFIGQAESYFISSMDGRLIQKGSLEGENYINVESLTDGLYVIQFITAENQIYKTTFVKE